MIFSEGFPVLPDCRLPDILRKAGLVHGGFEEPTVLAESGVDLLLLTGELAPNFLREIGNGQRYAFPLTTAA